MTVEAVVLDIEGVTSSVSSVRDQLFPYARRHVDEWVGRPEAARCVDEAREVAGRPDATTEEIADLMRQWIDADAKISPLKELQGMIWRAGFAAGELAAHVYEDVPGALRAWRSSGIPVHVYSSGSVLAQRLWFAHTPYGDLTPWLSRYFDTRNAGPKVDPASYEVITASIEVRAERTLFVSDEAAELDAARRAGWRTVQVVRPEEAAARPAAGHPRASNLGQVALDPALLLTRPESQDA
jgi:enolase-phosphatase E1